jgi:hypothetical protein
LQTHAQLLRASQQSEHSTPNIFDDIAYDTEFYISLSAHETSNIGEKQFSSSSQIPFFATSRATTPTKKNYFH